MLRIIRAICIIMCITITASCASMAVGHQRSIPVQIENLTGTTVAIYVLSERGQMRRLAYAPAGQALEYLTASPHDQYVRIVLDPVGSDRFTLPGEIPVDDLTRTIKLIIKPTISMSTWNIHGH